MPLGSRSDRERVVATRDGRRIVILQEQEAMRILRRMDCSGTSDRIERLEAFDLIRYAAPDNLNPIVRAQAVVDQLEIVEEYVEGFSLGGALELVREHISVNV